MSRVALLRYIFLVACAVSALFIDATQLPDYDSYQRIYNEASLEGAWEVAFVALCYFASLEGLDYDIFRWSIFIFDCSVSLAAFELIKKTSSNNNNKFSLLTILVIGFVFFSLILEFYEVRIRAGFAFSLALLGAILLIKYKSYSLLSLFVVLAANVHLATVAFLVITLASIFLFVLAEKNGFRKMANTFVYLGAFTLYIILLTSSESRGEELVSELNPARFFMLGVFPVIVFSAVRSFNSIVEEEHVFLQAYVKFMISMSLIMIILYPIGMLDTIGESLVRVYGLLSLLACGFAISSKTVQSLRFLLWFGVTNGLFFMNTVKESIF